MISLLVVAAFLAIAYIVGHEVYMQSIIARAEFLRSSGLGIKARRKKATANNVPQASVGRTAAIAQLERALAKSDGFR